MKLRIIALIITALWLTACEKVLEVDPVDYIPEEEAIQDKTDAERALTGCYDGLQQTGMYGRHLVIIPDIVADNLEWEGTTQEYGQFDNNSLLSDNVIVEDIWNAHYDVLNRINYLLYKLPDVSGMSQAERDNFLGQLYFLRALCHFNLVRLFGPIPVKTQPTLDLGSDLNPARDPVETVMQQIESDLLAAEGKITITNPGFATNGAVVAMLAMVYLHEKDYDQAKVMATQAITGYGYELETSYSSLFPAGMQTPGKEAIFTVLFDELDGNRLAEYFFPTSTGGRYEVAPGTGILSAYEGGDVRLAASVAGETPYVIKYPNLSTMNNNVYVIRLAEMYLIRAEAEARLEGSVSAIQFDINKIRTRAGLLDTEAETYEELLLAIEQERRTELAFEGKRWFDLVRTGRAMEVIETVTNTDQLLFPIPLNEIQTNSNPGMYQNPGY
ncbi:MAG: RagB/SusD family nutrient uptake outer membrane protein [Bacteroidetes bacterium]|nr:RagB/SusD family nutrient uptake outer membrane protein [Bacteroidota bacterium]